MAARPPLRRCAVTLTEDWLAAIDGTNALAATIDFSRHGLAQHLDPVDAARIRFEDADPVREFLTWPGRRNFEGKLWMASTGRHSAEEAVAAPPAAGQYEAHTRSSTSAAHLIEPSWSRLTGIARVFFDTPTRETSPSWQ